MILGWEFRRSSETMLWRCRFYYANRLSSSILLFFPLLLAGMEMPLFTMCPRVQGIADVIGVPHGDIVLLNILYEITAKCTSTVAQQQVSTPFDIFVETDSSLHLCFSDSVWFPKDFIYSFNHRFIFFSFFKFIDHSCCSYPS